MEQAIAIAELNDKLDVLTAQVQYLTEQARLAECARQDRAELMRDVMPIANGAMRLATEQLQEVEAYVDPQDLLRFAKKLLCHAPDIERLLDQLDSMTDLLEITGPMSKEMFARAEGALDGLDRKGYFSFARGSLRIVDNIVTSFSEDDVRQLGDNIVLILRTVKEMTQPEVMDFLRTTVSVAEKEAETRVDISYRSLLRQMNDPNVRRGLAQALRILSGIGGQTNQ